MSAPLVVLGDVLLDIDLVGHAGRIAPDAPALVLDGVERRVRPGGAALAAAVAAAHGREVVLVAPLGSDAHAAELRAALGEFPSVELAPLPWDGPTTVKQRVRASGQTLLRLDEGESGGTVGEVPPGLHDVLRGAGAILVADYGRGALAAPGVRDALAAVDRRTSLVWDPHPRGSTPLPGARLVTPNEREARLLRGPVPAEGEPAGIEEVASSLVDRWSCTAVAVTLGERGAILSYGDGLGLLVPGEPVSAADPCGAGDCFATTAALALADGALVSEAVTRAVDEATRFVREGGASALARGAHGPGKAPTVVATSGCFDLLHAGHVAMLAAARSLGDRLVVLLNSDDSVRRRKGAARPVVSEHDRARVLGALECVDEVIVFDEDTPVAAIERLRPDVWVKGGDYAGAELPEQEVLGRCGARVVLVPYLSGHSTTRLVERARAGVAAS